MANKKLKTNIKINSDFDLELPEIKFNIKEESIKNKTNKIHIINIKNKKDSSLNKSLF